ncbi:MAG: tyrosine-type recombinase/integrase [Gemmatimonadetes bacterium]|nr:tyrosine-type recombinase/integrase [Gemmatimonadota bacterium]
MKRPRLSAAFVRTVTRPGRYGDGRGGHGLSLLVKPTVTGRVSRTWAQRLKINGRPFNMGLGAYPIVTLAEARAKALDNRRAVVQGRDPRGGGIPTFEQATETVIALHAKNWKNGSSERSWRQTLRDFAFPKLGRKRVSEINTGDVLACLAPIWNEKRVTASRVRHRIGAVMKWAVAKGYREDNPAGDAIAAALPRKGARQKHHRALPHSEVGAALKMIRDADAWLGTRLSLEFIVLTATRSGEARLARWDEFDLDTATWTVPEARMKAGREHRVPLSEGALAVLRQARDIAGTNGLVFPSLRGLPPQNSPLSKLVRKLEIKSTVHGFRSSFRDWAAETGVERTVAEAALAHTVGGVEGAYFRSDLFERRREVMEAWSDYVSSTGENG